LLSYFDYTDIVFFLFVGRIHSAVISGVNLEAGSVTVEWFEKNEIKGKEACISFADHVARNVLNRFNNSSHVRVALTC